MKTLIVIPAYNEEKTLAQVIADLKRHGFNQILVVDDGSVDQTVKKARGAKVVGHIINRGLGAALGTGFAYAQKMSYDRLVTFDADGQHQAIDVRRLLAAMTRLKADVVVGSRLLWPKKIMPLDRLLLNHLSNLATYLLYGLLATDTLSGLRAFNKKAINCIKIKTQGMEVSNEFFKEIKRNKLRFQEIPIEPIYTDYSLEKSHQGKMPVPRLALAMILRLFR